MAGFEIYVRLGKVFFKETRMVTLQKLKFKGDYNIPLSKEIFVKINLL